MKRILLTLMVVALVVAVSTGVAAAASPPVITEYGVTNPVAWGLASLQTTRFYVKTPDAGTTVKIQVWNYAGIVKTIVNGPMPPVLGRWYTSPWGGTDASGHHLPMGNYKYRITLTRAGLSTTVEGPIAVSRSRWTLSGDGRRYLFPGWMYIYISATSPAPLTATGDRAYFQIWTDGFGTRVYDSDRWPVGAGFPFESEGSLPLYNSAKRWRSWRATTVSGLGTTTLLVLQ